MNAPFSREDWGELVFWRFVTVPPGVNACFTTRQGGFSEESYQSLNLGFHVSDTPVAVRRNREMLASILGTDAEKITSPRQRHTAVVRQLNRKEDVGSGAREEESIFDPCDGLTTTFRGAPLLLHYADCVPLILVAGGEQPAVAVIHAGRAGIMLGVVANGVRALLDQGYEPESISAAIGPAIGSCCYEVDAELAQSFAEQLGSDVVDNNYLDLPGAVVNELICAGVYVDSIANIDICTSCDKDFYSYRRDGVTGRHGAIAWIES